MGDWDVVGTTPAPAAAPSGTDPWAVIKTEDAPMKPLTTGTALLGELSAAGRAIPNALSAGVHGLDDLSQTLVGHGGEPGVLDHLAQLLHVGPSNAERNLTSNIATLPGVQTAGNAITSADQTLNTKLGEVSPALQHGVQATGRVANDINSLVPLAGPLKALGGATGDALAGLTAETRVPEDVPPTPVQQAGFVTPDKSGAGKFLAGDSAQTAQNLHNQQLHQTMNGAAANIPRGTPQTPLAFAAGRAEPNSVYSAAASSIPTGPVSPTAAGMIDKVGAPNIVQGSPEVLQTINNLKSKFTDPEAQFTGDDIIDNIRNQRAEGYQRMGSEDPAAQAVGKAQIQIANALDQHVADTLPANAPVSAADLAKARQNLAISHTAEAISRPGGQVDPQALVRIDSASPGMLTGNLKVMADAARANPEVNTLPPKSALFQPPSFGKDIQGALSFQRPVGSVIQAALGPLGRRMLTGNTADAVANAQQRFPGALGEDLSPSTPPSGPQPPPGMTASTPTAPAPAPAGPPGQIGLADLLSHGVGEGGPQGLSLAPEAPPPTGPRLGPQDLAAGFDTSGLQLEHPAVTANKGIEGVNHAVMHGEPIPGQTGSLGDVMSQGVPEGGMQRTAPVQAPQPGLNMNPGPQLSLQQPLGQAFEANQHPLFQPNGQPAAGAGAAPPSAPPAGPQVTENTDVSHIPGRAVLPGSTVISRGGNPSPGSFKPPSAQIVLTPQEDGSPMRITSHFVDPSMRQQGLGQQTFMDAMQHADGKPVDGDTTMTNDILHVAEALRDKGLISFEYQTPKIEAAADKALASKTEGVVVSGNGQPVIKNIRLLPPGGDGG